MNEDIFYLGIKAIIKNKEGKILLLKINPKLLKNNIEPYWDIPGGRIHKGDTILQTLEREIKEEIGINKIEIGKLFFSTISSIRIPRDNDDLGLILFVYECKIENENVVLSDEHIEYNWFDPKEASELLKIKYPLEFTNKII